MSRLAFHWRVSSVAVLFLIGIGCIGLVIGCVATAPPSSSTPLQKDSEIDQFTKGIRAFEGGRYRDAAALFRNVIASYPGSSFLMEAQWHLAKSYVEMGRKDLASRELDLFLVNYRFSRYEEQARLLQFQLAFGSKRVIAVTGSPDRLPQLRSKLMALNHPGINTILLEIPEDQLRKIALSSSGSSFQDDPLYTWINAARREKFRVIVKIPFRTMRWATLYDPTWRDQRYDIREGILKTTETLDLFSPDVKKMLLRLCRNIATYPIDGIYIDQISYRMEEGWTPSAQHLYQELFSEKLQVAHSFKTSWEFPRMENDPASVQFWRFAGLKSRYLADILTEVRIAVHETRENLLFGVSIPELLLVDPLEGFVQSSLDYLKMREARFDFFVVTKRAVPKERLYELLKKYGTVEDVWLEWDVQEGGLQETLPIQGIVVSGL